MLAALLFMPLAAGLLMLVVPSDPARRILFAATAAGHLALVVACLAHPPAPMLDGMLDLDAPGLVFLSLSSLLFFMSSLYAVGYLRVEDTGLHRDLRDNEAYTNQPEKRFCAFLVFFLAAMTLVACTRRLDILWVGIECTTLATAPLIYFHRRRRSLEAAWKYLLLCSVGIAMALLGIILLSIAFHLPGAPEAVSLNLPDLVAAAPQAQAPWLKAAFIFILVGYGVKMGLSPLHNWLPDAHSEAPSLVSALLSGALLNCAFLGILRAHQILLAADLGDFSGGLLVFFGLLSMGTAMIFIVGMGHFKRMLAYSSVEHMGVLALGVGLGGNAVFGAMLHAVNHSLTKAMLFLLAGNILRHYSSTSSLDVSGMRHAMPLTATLWMAGFLAVAGSPPFGLFVSEFSILQAMLQQDGFVIASLYLFFLAVIFVGMSVPVLRMVQASPPPDLPPGRVENLLNTGPPLVLCALTLMLGLYVPPWLMQSLQAAAKALGG
ncbi:MAG: NADH dehydrogenase FAD-containing subunit [Deltaproteobacteria bacterium]|nr:NADH dehydrogenase FAD-containing subunit [Deltaproteobacteria bacterium]